MLLKSAQYMLFNEYALHALCELDVARVLNGLVVLNRLLELKWYFTQKRWMSCWSLSIGTFWVWEVMEYSRINTSSQKF